MEENVDYKLRDDLIGTDSELQTVPIELLSKEYSGVIYQYLAIRLHQEDEQSEVRVIFEYNIVDVGNTGKTKNQLEKDKLFHEVIGLILNQMILEVALGENNAAEPDDITGDDRALNTKESGN